jgi:hypothetical protein|tara:strand:- start:78290 stop:79495 length:1206 start_codon:yes stop_codon:yes gene_type:complete
MITNKVKIPKDVDLLSLHKIYVELGLKAKQDFFIDLIIPIELTKNYLGISVSLIQFAATWLRTEKASKLIIDITTPNEKLLENLFRNEYLLPIIGLVWDGIGVYDKEGNNLRKYLKKSLNEVFIKMAKVEALKGEKLLLTNFDHFPESVGILPCFEQNGEYISSETELAVSLENVLMNDVLRNYSDTHLSYKNIKRSFSKIVYELMKNTFEWAKADVDDVPFDPNIRGVLIKFNKRKRSTLVENFKSNKGVSEYFNNEVLKENNQGELYFLEISVFDSGAGFISKYRSLNDNASKFSDIEVVKKCMIKHNTSSKGLNKGDKGIGLDKILRIISGKGLIRIKTGNKCVYRNLITEPYLAINRKNVEKMKLYDWSNDSDVNYTNYEPVSGSVVTIIFPLSIND